MVSFVKEFENYILSDKREDSLMSIIPGSEADIYLQLVKALSELESKGKEPENFEALMKKLNSFNSQAFKEIKFKKLLKSYDLTENQVDKEKIIKELKNIICPNTNFNFTRPTNSKINLNAASGESSNFPNALDQDLIQTPEKILEKFYANQYDISLLKKISNYNYLHLINWEKLNLNDFFNNWIIQNQIELFLFDDSLNLIPKITKFLDDESEKNKYFPNINLFLNGLSVDLLQKLSDNITSQYCDKNQIMNLIIQKTYQSELSEAKENSHKKEILLKIYSKVKDFPPKYQSLKSSYLLEILNLNILLNKFDLSLFLEYIKNPVSPNYSIFKHTEEQYNKLCSQQRFYLPVIHATTSDHKVIKDHLDYFFLLENQNIKTFEDFLDINLLKTQYFQSLILKGEENEEAIAFLSQSVYEKLINKAEISICKHNKDNFSIEEEVNLDLDIKNIQTLFVKIFEINTENYYYTQKRALDTSLSLEGLVACSDETYIFNEKPQIQKRKEFKLTAIPNKRGLFIVEFIGGGYSSRAIIKKGNLSIIGRETPQGKCIYILNEKSEICKPEKISVDNSENKMNVDLIGVDESHNTTGIWFKGTFYSANESGLIIIPYGKNEETDICIINHNGFSEIGNLNINMEQYHLDCAFNVNHESLTMGNTAKFIIKAMLTLNGREISLAKLKNCTLNAMVSKVVNGEVIPTSQIFDKINLKKNEEYSFELQIPPKLVSIELNLEAEVFNSSKQETQKLNSSYNFKNYENEENFVKMFLKKSEGKYNLLVLGKNGEVKSDCVVNLELKNKYLSESQEQIKLQTDKEGKIFLGKLNNISRISASLMNTEYSFIAQKWEIGDEKKFLYPDRFDVLENEKISIPVKDKDNETKGTILMKYEDDNTMVNNLTNEIFYKEVNEDKTRYNLEINGLKKGSYMLMLGAEKMIGIKVHQGKYWETEDYIITSDAIIQNKKSTQKILSISDLKIDQSKDEISITLQNSNENTRLHVYAYQFINPCQKNFLDILIDLYNQDSNSKQTKQAINNWKNIFLSNRKLNDEIQYVLDRKNLERQMGNSLEKPSLLLKRKYVRDTQTDKEVLEEGTNYEKREIDMIEPQMYCKKENMRLKCAAMKSKGRSANYMTSSLSATGPINAPENYPNAILNFNNFLSEASALILNCSAGKDNEAIKISNLNLNNYSHLQIFAVNESSCYEETVSLLENAIKKRDLTLKESLEAAKSFAELRITESFLENSIVKIEDITSTSFKIMDSIEKIALFKILLNKNLQNDWNDFKFLLNMDELSEEEKKNKITKFFSHELNLFLYFKYPDLFQKHILPILKFKAEKTFLDFFLLGDFENLTKFTGPNRIYELSVFEKCLLIFSIKDSNPDLAKDISNLIETETQNIINQSELKKYFDILMNMKNEGDKEAVNEAFGDVLAEQCDYIPRAMNCMMMNAPVMRSACRASPKAFIPRVMADGPQGEKLKKKRVKQQESLQMEEDECLNDDLFYGNEEDSFRDLQDKAIRRNFDIRAGVSKEYCETHFINGTLTNNNHLAINKYWADLAAFWSGNDESKKNFLSKNIILSSSNISELLFTLAVLDLPLRTKNHKFSREGEMGLKIEAASNLLLFTKTIKESNSNLDNDLMIAQSVYLNNFKINQQDNKNVTEFVPNKIYCHKANVINLSARKINFDMLIQIPEGSIPVRNSDYTKTINQNLENNICEFLTYFYFPNEGEFAQYPPTASREGIIISKGNPMKYSVREKQNVNSTESLDDVLETGSKEDILTFFTKQKIINRKDLQKIYWIMPEKKFFLEITAILRKKGLYDEFIWSMGFLHNEELCIKEYIENRKDFKGLVGNCFSSKLLIVDDSNNHDVLNHLDYHPLLNARVHKIGQANKLSILNREFRITYQGFIVSLISKKEISSKDYLRLSYYLILQDRIEEANRIFKKIQKSEISKYSSLEIQYDYINAYLDFSLGYPEFTISRSLCRKYKEFPLEQ